MPVGKRCGVPARGWILVEPLNAYRISSDDEARRRTDERVVVIQVRSEKKMVIQRLDGSPVGSTLLTGEVSQRL